MKEIAMSDNAYERGFCDALDALGMAPAYSGKISEKARAHNAGKKLAAETVASAAGSDQLMDRASVLGADWLEYGKSYPKTVGLALLKVGIDAESPEARSIAIEGVDAFIELHNQEIARRKRD